MVGFLQGAVAVYSLYTMYQSNKAREEMQKPPTVAEQSAEAEAYRSKRLAQNTQRRVLGHLKPNQEI